LNETEKEYVGYVPNLMFRRRIGTFGSEIGFAVQVQFCLTRSLDFFDNDKEDAIAYVHGIHG